MATIDSGGGLPNESRKANDRIWRSAWHARPPNCFAGSRCEPADCLRRISRRRTARIVAPLALALRRGVADPLLGQPRSGIGGRIGLGRSNRPAAGASRFGQSKRPMGHSARRALAAFRHRRVCGFASRTIDWPRPFSTIGQRGAVESVTAETRLIAPRDPRVVVVCADAMGRARRS